jgi:hypothetical protein
MSHLPCPKCGSNEHTTGYGLACGPMGTYTICECGLMLEFVPDLQGVPDERAQLIMANVEAWRKDTWEATG